MLDEFKDKQKITYRVLKNSIDNDKYSHAYLFETNGYDEKDKLILSFVKSLLCPFKHTNLDKCSDCHQCENIDKNIFPELKIINPDGMWIKKENLLSLQEEFRTKSLQANKKVYIINNAERLNTAAANSILKFLEEPEENIIAILVTDNIHQLLDTIISRCQIITLAPNKNIENSSKEEKVNNLLEKKVSLDVLSEMMINTMDFFDHYEKNKLDTIVYTKDLFHSKFSDKDDINIFFEIGILLYKEAINKKLNRNLEIFDDRDINIIDKNNKISDLNKKIQILINCKNSLKINANVNLLIDKMIIDLGGE